MKYPRASRALRRAPDPTLKRARFAHTTLLHTIGNLGLSRSWAPPDQILDPPLGLYKQSIIFKIDVDPTVSYNRSSNGLPLSIELYSCQLDGKTGKMSPLVGGPALQLSCQFISCDVY